VDRFGNPARSILLHVAVEQLKNLGTAAAAFWKQDYVAVAPGEMTLRGILGDSRLAQQLPKAPSEPRPLLSSRCEKSTPGVQPASPRPGLRKPIKPTSPPSIGSSGWRADPPRALPPLHPEQWLVDLLLNPGQAVVQAFLTSDCEIPNCLAMLTA
jgi:hypothetical protein